MLLGTLSGTGAVSSGGYFFTNLPPKARHPKIAVICV